MAQQRQYPFTHNLDELVAGLGPDAHTEALEDLEWLTEWAKAPRYPFDEVPTHDDAARAVAVARRIVEAAAQTVGP